jgi:hypothetical protein
MAISASQVFVNRAGKKRQAVTLVTMDSSYPTGGEAITAAQLGLATVDVAMCTTNTGHVAQYDKDNAKIKLYYADYDAVADGALIEVPAATDVSAVVVTVMAFGK